MTHSKDEKPILIPRHFKYSDDSFIYAYDNYRDRGNNPIPIFYKLDKDSLTIKESTDFLYKGEIDNFIKVVWTSHAGWIFHSTNQKNGEIQYFVSPILFKNLVKKEIFKVKLEKNQFLIHTWFLVNPESTLITYISVIFDETKNLAYFNVICLDLYSLSISWTNNYQFPYGISNFRNVGNFNIKVNQEGEPQFIFNTYIDGVSESIKKDGKRVANYEFRFFTLSKEGKIEQYKLDSESKFIKSIEFTAQNSSMPIISAYTYNKFNFNKLSGLMVFEIDDKNKEIKKLNEIEFNKEIIYSNIDGTDEKVKQDVDFKRPDKLQIVNIIRSNDSAIYVLGEVNFTNSVFRGDKWQSFNISGNILVTKISKEGKEEWIIIIPKSQRVHSKLIGDKVYEGKPVSFVSFLIQNKVHLFMNDNSKNYNTSDFKKVKEWYGQKPSFIHSVIENDGKYAMYPILNADDHPLVIDISSIKRIDSQSIFIYDHNTIGRLKF